MRLIDADWMLEHKYKELCCYDTYDLEEMLECVPTVDTERHGHWEEELSSQHGSTYDGRTWTKYKKYRCSYCGITNGNRRPDYCPNCGAKMDEVTE